MTCPICGRWAPRRTVDVADEPCARCWCEAPEDCEQWEQAMRRWWHGYEQRRMVARAQARQGTLVGLGAAIPREPGAE